MNDHDLFPGFATSRLRGAGAEVFARIAAAGRGPPLLLKDILRKAAARTIPSLLEPDPDDTH